MSEDNVIPFPKSKEENKVTVVAEPEKKKLDRIERKLEVTTENKNIAVEDGHDFIKNLKKEARRQKSMKVARDLEKQMLPVENLPTEPAVAEEIALAESFEIIEE